MDKVIGGVVGDGGVQVGKPFDVWHGHPIVDPNLQSLVVGGHPDSWNGKVRQNRVVGRQGHVGIRVWQVGKSDLEVKVLMTQS